MGKNQERGESPPGEITYQTRGEFILREVAGESLLVPTGEMAHKMNGAVIFTESGALLWKKLSQRSQTEDELADLLVEEYDISPAAAAEDVTSFLKKAVENDMIVQIEK